MARPVSAKDKAKSKPVSTESLYNSNPVTPPTQTTEPVAPPSKTTASNNPELVRKTYYYTEDLIKAISIAAALEGKDKSQIVREVLMDSRLKEYIEKIKSM